MKDVFIAQTPEQARLLQDMIYVGLLGRLLKSDASAGEVAKDKAQTVQQVHHRLTRLHQAELIEVRGERTRGGRPVKLYGPVAREYRVPFALTDAATVGELIRESHRPLLDLHYEAISRLQTADLLIRQNERGQMFMTLADTDGQDEAVLHSAFLGYRLTPQTVQELQERLTTLAEWLGSQALKREERGEDYLLGLLLAPGQVKR
ncbi:hypothetical protein [Deinococcus fonticola]|uniref:hypothetical protein n=1 Tax=Deinococcus fonticola TaxID=2528713 RepID=UPI0010750DFE|nr:hypothetical protein [Deinococcus fonticola]